MAHNRGYVPFYFNQAEFVVFCIEELKIGDIIDFYKTSLFNVKLLSKNGCLYIIKVVQWI